MGWELSALMKSPEKIINMSIFSYGGTWSQINEKGQLRLSHRALLPDASQEKSSVKQRAGTPMKENVPPQNTLDKGTAKKAATTTKDSLAHQVIEQHDKDDSKKVTSSGMEVPSVQDKLHDKAQSQDKVFKRVPSRDGPYINKEKQKKSSIKAATDATSKDEGILVNGETKIGK